MMTMSTLGIVSPTLEKVCPLNFEGNQRMVFVIRMEYILLGQFYMQTVSKAFKT